MPSESLSSPRVGEGLQRLPMLAGALVQLRHQLEVVGLGLLEPVRAGDGERAVHVRDRERMLAARRVRPRELAERVLLSDGEPSSAERMRAARSQRLGRGRVADLELELAQIDAALTSTMLSPRAAAIARAASSSVRARAKSPRSVWTRPRLLCDRAMNAESPTAARPRARVRAAAPPPRAGRAPARAARARRTTSRSSRSSRKSLLQRECLVADALGFVVAAEPPAPRCRATVSARASVTESPSLPRDGDRAVVHDARAVVVAPVDRVGAQASIAAAGRVAAAREVRRGASLATMARGERGDERRASAQRSSVGVADALRRRPNADFDARAVLLPSARWPSTRQTYCSPGRRRTIAGSA